MIYYPRLGIRNIQFMESFGHVEECSSVASIPTLGCHHIPLPFIGCSHLPRFLNGFTSGYNPLLVLPDIPLPH